MNHKFELRPSEAPVLFQSYYVHIRITKNSYFDRLYYSGLYRTRFFAIECLSWSTLLVSTLLSSTVHHVSCTTTVHVDRGTNTYICFVNCATSSNIIITCSSSCDSKVRFINTSLNTPRQLCTSCITTTQQLEVPKHVLLVCMVSPFSREHGATTGCMVVNPACGNLNRKKR